MTNSFRLFTLFAVLSTSFGAQAVSNSTIASPIDPTHVGVMTPMMHPNVTGSYYDWGKGQDGYAYCYQYADGGGVLNDGQPVDDSLCQAVHPSYYAWGRAQDGYGYCYQYSPYGVAMNEGQPVDNSLCNAVQPAYYSWGRSQDGYTYCYQYTANGIPMNEGQPVDNSFCQ